MLVLRLREAVGRWDGTPSQPSAELAILKIATRLHRVRMKVVVSIGGSVLVPEPGADRVAAHAAVVEDLVEDGCRVGAVVGGGGVAREYIGAARELGANEIELDKLGIDVTRLNARLLIAALGEDAVTAPAEDYEEAGDALRRGDVSVMGGVAPAQTTDAVGAALAEYVDADLLVYATSVPGVYSDDPNETEDATKYDSLTATELVDVIAGLEMNAGASAPVDLLAAKIIERSGMRTIVLDGTDPDRIARAVRQGDHEGTDVVPENVGAEPTYWASDEQ
jgi:uridylate kinase